MPGVVFLDVVMRADDVLQLVVDDHAGALGAHAAREQHHPRASVRVRALQHTAHNTCTIIVVSSNNIAMIATKS